MQKKRTKRAELIRRSIVYSMMVVLVLVAVTILVFLLLGYRFNRTSGEIQQGGLVQLGTRPTNASVKIGQANLTNTTDTKITVSPGAYTVRMNKSGYQEWSKRVDVEAGNVLWLNYAYLIPTDINTTTPLTFSSIDDAKTKSGVDKMVLLPDDKTPKLNLLDVGSDTPEQKPISLPSDATSSAKNATYSLGALSDGGDRVILKQKSGKTTDWIYVNLSDPEKSINLSTRYNLSIKDIVYDSGSNSKFFARLSDGSVRRIDTNADAVSGVLLRNIDHIALQNEKTLWYVTKRDKDDQVSTGYLSLGADSARTVSTYETTKPVHVIGGDYYGDTYISTTVGSRLTVEKTDSLPSSDRDSSPLDSVDVVSTNLSANGVDLTTHARGRFVAVQHEHSLSVYDIELKKLTDVPLPNTRGFTSSLQWIDDYHFWTPTDGKLRLYEFDGANQHDIAEIDTKFSSAAYLTGNGQYLYSIAKTDTGYGLQRSKLRQ